MSEGEIPEEFKKALDGLKAMQNEFQEKRKTDDTLASIELASMNSASVLRDVHKNIATVHRFKPGDLVNVRSEFLYVRHTGPYLVVQTRYDHPNPLIGGVNPVDKDLDVGSILFGWEFDVMVGFRQNAKDGKTILHTQWFPTQFLVPMEGA